MAAIPANRARHMLHFRFLLYQFCQRKQPIFAPMDKDFTPAPGKSTNCMGKNLAFFSSIVPPAPFPFAGESFIIEVIIWYDHSPVFNHFGGRLR